MNLACWTKRAFSLTAPDLPIHHSGSARCAIPLAAGFGPSLKPLPGTRVCSESISPVVSYDFYQPSVVSFDDYFFLVGA